MPTTQHNLATKAIASGAYLPDIEGLGVDNCRLNDLLGRENAPGDRIHILGGDVGVHIASLVDSHVGDAGLLVQPLLQALECLWRSKELNICLLVDIPAARSSTCQSGGTNQAIWPPIC